MSDGIYTALSGALAQEKVLSVVANNVANTRTTGYQADRVVFSELLPPSTTAPIPSAQSYVGVDGMALETQNGALAQTGNPLDLALQGEAYFVVEAQGGERYTRSGAFAVDGEGTLRTHSGLAVLGDGGPLQVPAGAKQVTFSPDGTLSVDGQPSGKLKLVRFESPDALSKEGLTLLRAQDGAAAVPAENATVSQGYLEGANVNAVAGMQELITVSRSFEAFQKVIETFHQLDQRTARDVGGK